MLIKIRPTGRYSCVVIVDGKETALKSLGMSRIAPVWVGETEDGGKVVYDFSAIRQTVRKEHDTK